MTEAVNQSRQPAPGERHASIRTQTQANHALQPTPDGVVSSAFAGYVTVPAWLSLGR